MSTLSIILSAPYIPLSACQVAYGTDANLSTWLNGGSLKSVTLCLMNINY
jgi:hypothetical protein